MRIVAHNCTQLRIQLNTQLWGKIGSAVTYPPLNTAHNHAYSLLIKLLKILKNDRDLLRSQLPWDQLFSMEIGMNKYRRLGFLIESSLGGMVLGK